MPSPFTIRIYVPEGDPEGIRIIDRLSSNAKFFAFPRNKWVSLKSRQDFMGAGVYILSGYAEGNTDLPTIYVGQADLLKNRIEQQIKNKDFWDKAVVFTSVNTNSTHAQWLEHTLIKKLIETKRSIVENGNSPQEPTISEAERAEMEVFLAEIYQTLPLAGIMAFEKISAVVPKDAEEIPKNSYLSQNTRDTIIVPAQEEGFRRVFIGENAWWAIRISGGMLEKIKYIAAYQVAPISAITHVAEVKSIEQFGEDGKYKLIFKGPAKKLEKPIISDLLPGSMQGTRYTSFDRLIKAGKMSEIF